MSFIEVTIINWDKYNPKRDQSTYSWLRLNNDFYLSQDLFGLTAEQKMFWVVLLCLASRANKPTVSVNLDYIAHHLGMKHAAIVQALEIFSARQLTTAHDRALPLTTPTNERTNVTNERTILLTASQFAEIYALYPKKIGKEKGLKRLRETVKTPEDFALLMMAVQKYRAHVAAEGTEPKFIKHFSTWVSSWRDWTDPEVGSSTTPSASKPDLSGLGFDDDEGK